ncbi:MAG: hypothetical protein KatS3mg091_375 [Patescibacteria group bacterium]|nr:MAG: hypothetical protein KatS3mg091_375 [Patescibacteria group bacterium]
MVDRINEVLSLKKQYDANKGIPFADVLAKLPDQPEYLNYLISDQGIEQLFAHLGEFFDSLNEVKGAIIQTIRDYLSYCHNNSLTQEISPETADYVLNQKLSMLSDLLNLLYFNSQNPSDEELTQAKQQGFNPKIKNINQASDNIRKITDSFKTMRNQIRTLEETKARTEEIIEQLKTLLYLLLAFVNTTQEIESIT